MQYWFKVKSVENTKIMQILRCLLKKQTTNDCAVYILVILQLDNKHVITYFSGICTLHVFVHYTILPSQFQISMRKCSLHFKSFVSSTLPATLHI